jgi:hypothetical protein
MNDYLIEGQRQAEPNKRITMRNTFISPELAYSNERRKLFDKIGYNKNLNKSTAMVNSL